MDEVNSQNEFEAKLKKFRHGTHGVEIHLENCQFNFAPTIPNTASIVKFINCIFKEDTKFSLIVGYDTSFNGSKFEKNVSFNNSHFYKKARFQNVKFIGQCTFENTKFDDLADFWGAEFYQPIIFFKTDFKGITVFSKTTFRKNVLFTYSKIKDVMILRGTIFLGGLDLSLLVEDGKYSLFDIRLEDYEVVPDPENEDEYEEYVTESGIITEKNKRETFRAIKKQLQSQGNNYDALIFSNLETSTYHSELKRKLAKRGGFRKYIQDYLVFELNYWSNRNNRSWGSGILFTFLVGLFFFYLAVINTDKYHIGFENMKWSNFWECVEYYFAFITPTHDIDLMTKLKPDTLYYFWDFLGRIFVAYGIYQTVRAFRIFKND